MKIAIKANPSRGKEIISLLKSLGGNRHHFNGSGEIYTYYIDNNNIIQYDDAPKDYKVYTLEEFEKEFPFKVGDIVLLKGLDKPYEIIALEWFMNKLCYKLDSGLHYAPGTLTTYEKMKKERNITLTIDKAKEWYKKGGELREIALQAFTEKELNSLPRSWEEFCKQGNPVASWRYSIPIKYEALFKLEQLKNCWWNGWEPNWNDGTQIKYCICHYREEFKVTVLCETRYFLSFPTREMAEEFLECFRDLIEKAGDLI